jgi:hypothetical protein
MSVSIAGVAATLALSACGGGGDMQSAHEPKGKFTVSVPTASFPSAQRISDHTHLVIAVRNDGRKTIPNVAVTICNVTCAYPGPQGAGTHAQAFASDVSGQYLANSSRPNWVVEQGPGKCGLSCSGGGQGGGQGAGATAYSNTWALGPLRPGKTMLFKWKVTAVAPGTHVIAWQVAAGLNGNARAVLANGSPPGGKFTVTVNKLPAQSFVDNSGKIVTTP